MRVSALTTIMDALDNGILASEHCATLTASAQQAFTDQADALRRQQRSLQEILLRNT